MKPKAVVWFTGVISKFNLSDDSLENIQVNNLLYNKLKDKYNLIFIIKIPDDEYKEGVPNSPTKLKYQELFANSNIKDDMVIYIPYSCTLPKVLENLISQYPDITTYIDYSKHRLISAACYIQSNKAIHLSQLID